MTQDDILNGRLICEIGIAPVRPAEFVIFRIFQRLLKPNSKGDRKMARKDPLRNFRFRPRDRRSHPGRLQRSHDRRDHHRRGRLPRRHRPVSRPQADGLTKYGNITLKWGVTDSVELYNWHKAIVAGQIQSNRKQVAIVVQDESGADKARFTVAKRGL